MTKNGRNQNMRAITLFHFRLIKLYQINKTFFMVLLTDWFILCYN
jgi:hypothetical protein